MQLAVVLIVLAVPIAWTFLSAFKPRTEVAAIPPRLIFTPTLENFVELFGRNDFLSNTLNSLIVATGSTLLGLALGVPAAFAVSWHQHVLASDRDALRAHGAGHAVPACPGS